jgi:RNA polymerase subunit RPABC4/transcription elongation factor Spt4
MTCPKCMAMVASSSNYCGYCGNRLRTAKTELKICARCGSRIQASSKFCPDCGEDVGNPKLKMRLRFAWLKDVEKRYASDYTRFRAAGVANAEDEEEEPVFDKAKKKAKDTNEPVMIYVSLHEKRGEIDSFPWALIRPDGTIEYI